MFINQSKGITAGVLAGVFWGVPFLVPLILLMFSPIEIAFGRFLFFGLISLTSLPNIVQLCRQFSLNDFIKLITLSATGYWLYTIILVYGVRLTNGVTASLIIGMLPVTITLFSKPVFNTKLWLSLTLLFLGMNTLLLPSLIESKIFETALNQIYTGLLLLVVALIMWSWFALANARFLKKHPQIKLQDYSSLMGLLSFICMVPIFMWENSIQNIISNPSLPLYFFWSAILGIGSSWIAYIFWAYCSKSCLPAVYGPLIVSETVFGLAYNFILQNRLPYLNEIVAIVFLITGVIFSILSQQRIDSNS